MYLIDKLDNGIKVVMESIPYVNSVSIGVIVNTGSINENKYNNGVSHFIEHMLFKGTKNKTAKEIAETIDNIGGQINAFTGKESTCYYTRVLDRHCDIGIEVLADMLNNSLFKEEEIEKEKTVITEEINMYLDSPDDLVSELLNESMFENTTLAYPILGTEKSILSLKRESIMEYFYKYYSPREIVISLSGNIDTKETLKKLNYCFGNFNNKVKENNNCITSNNNYQFTNKIKNIKKDTEQLNLCIGFNGVSTDSDYMESMLVMNNVFGGSMSSRLFQKIREDLGLAYSIYSYPSAYKNTGIFTIYAGLNPSHMINVIRYIEEEIKYIKKNLISKDQLKKSKDQLKANYILGMEGTFDRMYEIGKSLSLLDRVQSPDEIMGKIDKVSMEDIESLVNIVFNKENINISYVGEVDNQNIIHEEMKKILF